MVDGLEQAAQAFDAVIKPDVRPTRKAPAANEGPTESLFGNLGELDRDTPPKGGGDDLDPEELLYGKAKTETTDPRDSGKRDRKNREDGPPKDPDDDDDDGDRDPDDDEDTEHDEESEQETDEFLNQKVEVTVDGEPQEVSVKEALEGYIRTETFHRRMNQLDEAKKIVRRAAADAVHNYEYSMNIAKQMQAHMDQMIPKEPDWDAEFQKDPAKARELQRYYERANGFRAQLRAQMEDAAKKQAESTHTQLAAFAEEESSKFEAMNRKNWSDPHKKAKDLSSMRKTGLASGFTEEELSQVYDSRMLMVLLKASKYDRMMAAKPKPVVRTTNKPIPPGAGSARQRTAQKGVNSAMKRLNRTGSIEDAAAVFDQIIARG